MIVDCHAHVFAHWAGACGHPSSTVHLKYLQKVVTRPWAKAFRARDGHEIKPTMLFRSGDNTWDGLTDVGFRVGRFGQLVFSCDGEDYYVQYLPVGMQELACPPELMMSQMTYAAVDHCILQAGGGYGVMNDYNAYTQHQHPQKFSGLLNIDEPLADRADTLAEVDRAVNVLGLRGLYYAQDFSRHGYSRNVNHPAFGAFWDKIVGYRLPVFIELSSTPNWPCFAPPRWLGFTPPLTAHSDQYRYVMTEIALSTATLRRPEERVSAAYLYSLLRLPWLAPDITTAIINGRKPPQLAAKTLMRLTPRLPAGWAEQRKLLGFR